MLAPCLNLPSGLISELHRAVLQFDYLRAGPGFISEPSNSEPAGIHCSITVYQLCGFERADPIICFLLYIGASVAVTFYICAATLLVTRLLGRLIKQDLTTMGNFMYIKNSDG